MWSANFTNCSILLCCTWDVFVQYLTSRNIYLMCLCLGLTNAVVQWRRREGPLPPNHSIQGGTLYIPRFQREYAGEYICTATTPVRNYETSIFIIVTGK